MAGKGREHLDIKRAQGGARKGQQGVFFSKTAGPIKAKFHTEPHWDGGTKIVRRVWVT